ncbi:Mu-like prophage I protein [Ensifer adhaerens]|nr:Mu-like prophage I protein [Ensifer adhaerens]
MTQAALQTARTASQAVSETIGEDNRQWVQLIPAGTLPTIDGRGPYRVENMAQVIDTSNAISNVDKLPIDYNHALDLVAPKGGEAPAAGWIERMEARSDGIWGLVEWTPRAANAIRAKEYRFLSPVIAHQADKTVSAILRASLTNVPNLTMKALNAAQKANPMDYEEFLAALRTALNLPADADEAQIIEAVKANKSLNSADPARFVPIETFQQTLGELNKLRSGVSLQAAERIVETAMQEGCLLPFMRDWAVNLCQANSAAFDDFLEGAGKPVAGFVASIHHKTDYSALRAKDRDGGSQLTEVHQKLGLSAEDVKAYGGKTE